MMSFDTIIIEFLGHEWGPYQPIELTTGSNEIRLVEMKHDGEQVFALYEGSRSIYTLTPDETTALLGMLETVSARALWRPLFGKDGGIVTLVIRGLMSEMTFSWWVEPPKEWSGVGKIADFALSLWNEHR